MLAQLGKDFPMHNSTCIKSLNRKNHNWWQEALIDDLTKVALKTYSCQRLTFSDIKPLLNISDSTESVLLQLLSQPKNSWCKNSFDVETMDIMHLRGLVDVGFDSEPENTESWSSPWYATLTIYGRFLATRLNSDNWPLPKAHQLLMVESLRSQPKQQWSQSDRVKQYPLDHLNLLLCNIIEIDFLTPNWFVKLTNQGRNLLNKGE